MTSLRPPIALLAAALLLLMVGSPVVAQSRAQFPVQSVGDRGADVVALQHLLRASGHDVVVSGDFDADTRSAVMAFQSTAGLNSSGIAHPSTWEALVPALSQGSSGEAVVALRKQLNAKSASALTIDTSFDLATQTAVRAFQEHMGLARTGSVDKVTWRNLIWHYMKPHFGTPGLCNYNGGSLRADWGTAAAVAHVEAASASFHQQTGTSVAIGDMSFEHGGPIDLHRTHEDGLDIDIALIRTDGRQCSNPGISYKSVKYDRGRTRALLRAIHATFGEHLRLIYFNDPVMVHEGLSQKYPNHNDHIHVRLCEPGHQRARYVC